MQQSRHAFKTKAGAVVTPQEPKVVVYRGDIRIGWGEPAPTRNPVRLRVEFSFRRPQYHVDSRGSVKPKWADARFTGKPDLDKLVRSVMDALTGYAFVDDSQVIEVEASKRFSETEQTFVSLREVS